MYLLLVTCTMFKSPGKWEKFDLDCILFEGDQLFKFIGKIRYLGMEDLSQKLLVEKLLAVLLKFDAFY